MPITWVLSRSWAFPLFDVHGKLRGLQNSRLVAVVAFKIEALVICFAKSRFGLGGGGESAGYLVVHRALLHFESGPRSGAGIATRAARGALQGERFAEEWAEGWHTSSDDDNVLFDTMKRRISEQERMKDISAR